MSIINEIQALEILDSRGNPTIQVEVFTTGGGHGIARVPSGASTGSREALEMRDGDDTWFGGKGVGKAVSNINNIIAPEIVGMDVSNQRAIDRALIELDGTENKDKLGANAILGVSLAVAHAAADVYGMELYRWIGGANAHVLPLPMLNVINGGEHASNTIDFQEFMIMPVGAESMREALIMANKVFHTLAKLLKKAGHGTQVGDEGGFAPNLKSHEEVLDLLVEAITAAGYKPAKTGEKAIAIALDCASSELYDNETKTYTFAKLKNAIESKKPGFENINAKLQFTSDELVEYLTNLANKYPIISIEDGLAEGDWDGFKKFTKSCGDKLQIVGDDLTVTNPKILARAIEEKAMNSILIKLNQIGTLTETIDAIEMAHKAGFTAVVSHRSGETEDTTIADLAVALNTGQIKTGSLSRTDRVAKYNRLLTIEAELGCDSKFSGEKAFFNIKK